MPFASLQYSSKLYRSKINTNFQKIFQKQLSLSLQSQQKRRHGFGSYSYGLPDSPPLHFSLEWACTQSYWGQCVIRVLSGAASSGMRRLLKSAHKFLIPRRKIERCHTDLILFGSACSFPIMTHLIMVSYWYLCNTYIRCISFFFFFSQRRGYINFLIK